MDKKKNGNENNRKNKEREKQQNLVQGKPDEGGCTGKCMHRYVVGGVTYVYRYGGPDCACDYMR